MRLRAINLIFGHDDRAEAYGEALIKIKESASCGCVAFLNIRSVSSVIARSIAAKCTQAAPAMATKQSRATGKSWIASLRSQ
jgi:hypothetical protein